MSLSSSMKTSAASAFLRASLGVLLTIDLARSTTAACPAPQGADAALSGSTIRLDDYDSDAVARVVARCRAELETLSRRIKKDPADAEVVEQLAIFATRRGIAEFIQKSLRLRRSLQREAEELRQAEKKLRSLGNAAAAERERAETLERGIQKLSVLDLDGIRFRVHGSRGPEAGLASFARHHGLYFCDVVSPFVPADAGASAVGRVDLLSQFAEDLSRALDDTQHRIATHKIAQGEAAYLTRVAAQLQGLQTLARSGDRAALQTRLTSLALSIWSKETYRELSCDRVVGADEPPCLRGGDCLTPPSDESPWTTRFTVAERCTMRPRGRSGRNGSYKVLDAAGAEVKDHVVSPGQVYTLVSGLMLPIEFRRTADK